MDRLRVAAEYGDVMAFLIAILAGIGVVVGCLAILGSHG